MNNRNEFDFERIEKAIHFISLNFKDQPSLDVLAKKVSLSPFHFQRLFTRWAGVSPKTFLQYTSFNYSKSLLREKSATLFDTANESGLSGTGRLHDLFIKIEGMTPAEFKNGGKNLDINYSIRNSPFGKLIVASTSKGICYMAFVGSESNGLKELTNYFPQAQITEKKDVIQNEAISIFDLDWQQEHQIKLHLRGSAFQIKVWEALLKIPFGGLTSYKTIARGIHQSGASRAVGSAVGANPVAFLIPCHRVIQSTGEFGNYMWGSHRKFAMIGWEATKKQSK